MTYPVFASGDVLNASDMNNVGMWKTAAVTFSGSAGVEVQNCFSGDYTNYKVLITYWGSAGTNTQFQYMTGTNTRDTNATYDRWGYYWTTGIVGFNATSTTSSFLANHFTAAKNFSTAELTVFQPFVANVNTVAHMHSWSGDSGLAAYLDHSKVSNSQFTGLYFFPTSGTVTGTITVYGMRN
jgi:hypothetical protein